MKQTLARALVEIDLGALQAHLGWRVLQTVSPKTAPSEPEFLKARPAVRLDAVESYVRGLHRRFGHRRQRRSASQH